MDKQLELAEKISYWMDSKYKVLGFRFGLDPLIGLVPFFDVIPSIISLYLVLIALNHKLPLRIILKMIFNVFADYLTGSIPILGDIFDFRFKANVKNIRILKSNLK